MRHTAFVTGKKDPGTRPGKVLTKAKGSNAKPFLGKKGGFLKKASLEKRIYEVG